MFNEQPVVTRRNRRPLIAIAFVGLLLAPLASMPAEAVPVAQWAAPARAFPDTAVTSQLASVFVAEDGSAMQVAAETFGAGVINSRRFTPATGWQDPVRIATGAISIPDCTFRAAGNRAGDVFAAWFEWNGTQYVMYGIHYTAGWGWTSKVLLSSSGSLIQDCRNHAVAIDESGDAISVWQTNNGTTAVRASRYELATGWTGEETVAVNVNMTAYDLGAGYDSLGVPTVIWGENNGSDEFLYSSQATGIGTWTAAQLVFMHFDNGPAVVWTDYIRVAEQPSNELLIVFQVYNQTLYTIWQARYAGGVWTASMISDLFTTAQVPMLAVAGDGTAMLAYRQNNRVATKLYTPGLGWGGSTNHTGAVNIAQLGIASNLAGQRVVVWQEFISGAWHIRSREWSPWGLWVAPARTVDPLQAASTNQWPTVGVDGRGDAIASWVITNGTAWSVWNSRFRWAEANPLPLTITSPRNRESVGSPTVVVEGRTAAGASLDVNGVRAAVQADGRFAVTVPLREGWNFLTATALAPGGQTSLRWMWVAYSDPSRAQYNESQDDLVSGFTEYRLVAAGARVRGIYNSYGGIWYSPYASSMGPGGDGAAFWLTNNGTLPYVFFVAAYLNGSGWQAPHLVQADFQAPYTPFIVTDAAGRSTLVWQWYSGTRWSVYALHFDPLTGWGDMIDLSPNSTYSHNARIAVGTTGLVFVAFVNGSGPASQYVSRQYTPGSGWGPETFIATVGTASITEHVVAVAGANSVLAAWMNRSAGNSTLWAHRYTPGSGWSTAATAVPTGPYIYDLRGVLSDAGEATLVYRTTPAGSTTVNLTAARSDSSNSWGSPVEIDGRTQNSTLNWRYGIGVDAQGAVTVMFLQDAGTLGSQRAHANRYVPGLGWTGAVLIDNDTSQKGWTMGDVSPDGTAMAAYHRPYGGHLRVETVRYIPSMGWQAPEYLTPEDEHQYDPWVAMTTGGRAIVTPLHHAAYPAYDGTDVAAYHFSPPDITPPTLALGSPTPGSTLTTPLVWVLGITDPGARAWVNDVEVQVNATGLFGVWLPLQNGTNTISVVARDEAGNPSNLTISVTYDDPDRRRIEQLEQEAAALWQGLADQNASLIAQLAAQNASLIGQIAALNATLLAQMAAQDTALAQLIADTNASLLADLAALDSDLTQAIGDLNISLLAEMAAEDAALAAQIAATNATLFAALAAQDASLLQALAGLNASLLAEMSAADQAILADLAAGDAALTAQLATVNTDLLAALANQNDELLAQIAATNGSLLAQLALQNASLMARLTANHAQLWTELNATSAAQNAALAGTQSGLDTTNSSLTETQNELAQAQQAAASAGTVALIGLLLAAAGLAAAVVAIMIGRRRPPMLSPVASSPMPPPTPGGAEEIEVETVPERSRGHGTSMAASAELAGSGEND